MGTNTYPAAGSAPAATDVVIATGLEGRTRRRVPFGVRTDAVRTDMAMVQGHKRAMVDDLIKVHLGRYDAGGVDLIMGEVRFAAPKTVTVMLSDGGSRTIAGGRVILSVVSRATIPSVPGLADAQPMTHVEALDLERVPDHLVVVGGGYIGLELAQAARQLVGRT
jgi:pyruvate/2-oxoglutarate dehydrogenase complex dihydrolipoamide dehydrogenase (E3) component